MYAEAIAERQQLFRLAGDDEDAQALGEDFKALGFQAVMRQLYLITLESLEEAAKTQYVSPTAFAVAYAKLDDKEHAFAWLEKADAERTSSISGLKTNPEFDNLRSDPRFAALVKKMGLS